MAKIYFEKTGRFSEDLDFTAINLSPEQFQSKFSDLFNQKTHYGITFGIIEDYFRKSNGLSSYGAVARYDYGWGNGSFELNVSFREEPILPVTLLEINNALYFRYTEFKPFKIPCLQKEEILAEKIRAAFERFRPRDLYDLYLFSMMPYNKELVAKMVPIKLWNVRRAFVPQEFFNRISSQKFDESEIARFVRGRKVPKLKQIIDNILKEYVYLNTLDKQSNEIVKDARSHGQKKLVEKVTKILRGENQSKGNYT